MNHMLRSLLAALAACLLTGGMDAVPAGAMQGLASWDQAHGAAFRNTDCTRGIERDATSGLDASGDGSGEPLRLADSAQSFSQPIRAAPTKRRGAGTAAANADWRHPPARAPPPA